MNENESRLYSLDEIKDMVVLGEISPNLVGYLKRVPENVFSIVLSWAGNEEKKKICQMTGRDFQCAMDEPEILDDDNPYKDMAFNGRLEIRKVYLTLYDDNICPKHGTLLYKMQTVILYGGNRRYGATIPCCKTCKKLFMSHGEWNELKPIFNDKAIVYCIKEQ